MNSKKTQKVTTTIVVLLIVSVIIFILLNINLNSKVSRLEELSSEIKAAGNLNAIALQKDVESSEEKLSELKSYFINSGNVIELISLVENLAEEQGLDFSVTSINDEVEDGEKLEMTVQASGSWNNVNNFISRIETMPKVVKIKKTTLNFSSGNENTPPGWRSELILETLLLEKDE
jgi:Tfp pilus assembly protein PilO